jgi:hypothetical protein
MILLWLWLIATFAIAGKLAQSSRPARRRLGWTFLGFALVVGWLIAS